MIDRFSRVDFEAFLDRLLSSLSAEGLLALHAVILPLGLREGEFTYKLPLPEKGWLYIRSSIDESGYAADKGQDSIRIWVGDRDGRGLLHKEQAWVTRQLGWRDRMTEVARTACEEWRLRGAQIRRMKESNERTMLARFPGRCAVCHQAIEVDQPIAKRMVRGRELWVHFECPITIISPVREEGGEEVLDVVALQDFFARSGMTVRAGVPSESLEQLVFVPSAEQEVVFDWVEHGEGNGVVESVAGSGKTTTLVGCLNRIPRYVTENGIQRVARVIFLAYGKPIRNELKRRQREGQIPANVRINTVHSLGLLNLMRILEVRNREDFVDDNKVNIIFDAFPDLSVSKELEPGVRAVNALRRQVLRKIVSLCRGTMLDAVSESQDIERLVNLADTYSIDLEDLAEDDLYLVHLILDYLMNDLHIVDYDDMCWLPIQWEMKLEQFDYILVDEAQDLNLVQIQLVLNSLAPGGRVLAVGDRHQSLFGYRGADVYAIPRLIDALHARTMSLSVCYRCPTEVLRLAQRIVPEIQPRPNAPEGLVMDIPFLALITSASPGDMILCRTNAPLIPIAYALIRRGVKALVRGRKIGEGLIQLVDKFQASNLTELSISLREYVEREGQRLTDNEKWGQLQALQDKVETLLAVMSECSSVAELQEKLSALFSDDLEGVICSSIHGAKGLQAKRVFIVRRDLLPHPLARLPWQKIQEENAEYVAITRAEEELLFVIEGGQS